MMNIREQVFGPQGYSSDLRLSDHELSVFRELVSAQWLAVIATAQPSLSDEARRLGIANYHLLAPKLDHRRLWPKSSRLLSRTAVSRIRALPFLDTLEQAFGQFSISDIYDTHQHHGEEEIYWRLVRPGCDTDVGPIHADKWFHAGFNDGRGMFSDAVQTVKIWIPLYCQPGRSGLAIAAGSHLKSWRFRIESVDGQPRPVPDDDFSACEPELIATEPGQMLVFNEGTLHRGVVNDGSETRVSAEITMVMPRHGQMAAQVRPTTPNEFQNGRNT